MNRRACITLLGGAAAAWPLAAHAQQPPKTAKVGILYPGTAATLLLRVAGLREGLRAAGYREPDNVELLSRAAEGDPKRIAPLAMELAEHKVDVMVPVSPAAVHAALARARPSQLSHLIWSLSEPPTSQRRVEKPPSNLRVVTTDISQRRVATSGLVVAFA